MTTTINNSIGISNSPIFRVNVLLENQSVNILFAWNNKTKRYHATATKTNGTLLFEGIQINPLSTFPISSLMSVNGLYGTFTLYPKDKALIDTDETLRNWEDYYFLIYSIVF